MVTPETRGGLRPTAPQYNPANVNPMGGNGTNGDYTGFGYGENKALNESRIAGNQATASIKKAQPNLQDGTPMPSIPGILDETQFKEQSIMDGAPIGPGANSISGLPVNISNDPDIRIIQEQFPIMEAWASMPGTNRATAEYVNYLKTIFGGQTLA